jgi:hypothetical protein
MITRTATAALFVSAVLTVVLAGAASAQTPDAFPVPGLPFPAFPAPRQAALPLPGIASAPIGLAQLSAGETVRLVLVDRVHSGSVKKGERVAFQVQEDVMSGSLVLIRRGTPAYGTVTAAKKGGLPWKRGALEVRLDYTTSVDGQRVRLAGELERDGKSSTLGKVAATAKSLLSVGANVLTGSLAGSLFGGSPFKGRTVSFEPGTQVEARIARAARVAGIPATELAQPDFPGLPDTLALPSPAAPFPTSRAFRGPTLVSTAPFVPAGELVPAAGPVPSSRPGAVKSLLLRNGERITGRIIGMRDGVYTVETRYGTLQIGDADIRQIQEVEN